MMNGTDSLEAAKLMYKTGWHPGVQKPSVLQLEMKLRPVDLYLHDGTKYRAAGKLEGKKALVTGGDSGIGRSISILFALEGADISIVYLPEEQEDAEDTKAVIERETNGARNVTLLPLDLRTEENCVAAVQGHIAAHGVLDCLVLNHGIQQEVGHISDLSTEQWLNTFDTNIHPFFYLCRAAIPHIPPGGSITMNSSVNPFCGNAALLDYTSTKGAIVAFARSLSNQIVGDKGIRVNTVCPGPIWTPMIPATITEEHQARFGTNVPMRRAGQPIEAATCFVFLASADAGFITGQTLHPNGGKYAS